MNLIVDIGNTRSKVAIFRNNEIVAQRVFPELMICDLEQLLTLYPGVEMGILSSTAVPDEALLHYLSQTLTKFIEFNGTTPVPFEMLYKTPETVGPDRLAVIAGASSFYPSMNVLVIDAGSAITYEFISAANEYEGGNISPGLEMRFKALHTFTGKLPLCSKRDDAISWGDNTESAIIAGVQEGMLAEVRHYIEKFEKQYDNIITMMTGGDADFFAGKLKNAIFVEPNLTLIGLNRILQFHAE